MNDGFVIKIIDKNDEIQYLVDRKLVTHKWWDSCLSIAMVFKHKGAAVNQLGRLKFNNPEIISLEEAERE